MIKAVIFDIDGTLLDSFESNLSFFQELMKLRGYKPVTREKYAPLFHKPSWDIIKILTGLTDDTKIKEIWDFMHTVNIETKPQAMPDGTAEVIKTISKQYLLGIASGRDKKYIYEAPLDTLQPYFKVAVSYEDTVNHKPHPEPLMLAANKLGLIPRECLYVGDAETDMQAAHAAGMKFLLYSKNKLPGADYSVSDFAEIPATINRISKLE